MHFHFVVANGGIYVNDIPLPREDAELNLKKIVSAFTEGDDDVSTDDLVTQAKYIFDQAPQSDEELTTFCADYSTFTFGLYNCPNVRCGLN